MRVRVKVRVRGRVPPGFEGSSVRVRTLESNSIYR
jgi:hypothetical protein